MTLPHKKIVMGQKRECHKKFDEKQKTLQKVQ